MHFMDKVGAKTRGVVCVFDTAPERIAYGKHRSHVIAGRPVKRSHAGVVLCSKNMA
jgi:hypothetical protein